MKHCLNFKHVYEILYLSNKMENNGKKLRSNKYVNNVTEK